MESLFLVLILCLQIALVGQEPVLFARTVRENITYGLTDVSMEAVVEAATKANAHDFISALPNGYDTSNYEICSFESVWFICIWKLYVSLNP